MTPAELMLGGQSQKDCHLIVNPSIFLDTQAPTHTYTRPQTVAISWIFNALLYLEWKGGILKDEEGLTLKHLWHFCTVWYLLYLLCHTTQFCSGNNTSYHCSDVVVVTTVTSHTLTIDKVTHKRQLKGLCFWFLVFGSLSQWIDKFYLKRGRAQQDKQNTDHNTC